ncbi:hypothetical protein Tcur_3295 [Thermomonospora curvata DSM 43183]|uniref:Uncharacterized protein n=1 Tax=Thermomonospora curvata (strain ATCC 19995 / DSM 43183 / JCM 3096 / KCTC 9072 / NBRC 15933 / NCIMB 10081 / Henssen B9) TaxID=471852 RepID=D1AAC1_THECD|nr:hypothetical protein Tcur_3295 [Thermomonospora curvata DSM 43183]
MIERMFGKVGAYTTFVHSRGTGSKTVGPPP